MFFVLVLYINSCFFFFSSRRRHTRCLSDWSSDVCSSDLKDPEGKPAKLERREHFQVGRSFEIADITVTAFTIPHDAADPCGFTFKADGVKIGVVTDLGYLPYSVKDHLRRCDGLMIESNHDLEMLRNGPYPWMVKQRVMS